MHCLACQSDVRPGARFCTACGEAVPRSCPGCGAVNDIRARFCSACGRNLLSSDHAPETPALPPAASGGTAERRHLSVMFCDLVGSTALSTEIDPEDLRDVLADYQAAIAAAVTRFEGYVALYMGDGVLAFFGYPQAHEDNAERAVRAGFAAIEAVQRLSRQPKRLQARVGIATGLVVVGDLVREGANQEQVIVGETPNLAARLQSLADPNEIVIDAATHGLLRGLFEYRSLGEVRIKGLPGPVPVYCVTGASQVGSRFEALRGRATPLVGRSEEIELLARRWAQAKSEVGSVVLLSGEAGIGKSRLVEAFRETLGDEPLLRLRYFCSPYHRDSALFPVIDQLQRAAGIRDGDPDDAKLQKVRTLLVAGTPEDDVALIAALLSIPAQASGTDLSITPQRRKEKTFEALLRQFRALTEAQPVLIVFEDLHWADPTSLELVDLAIERLERWRVLLVATFRPDFSCPWTGHPRATTLSLRRLGLGDSTELVRGVVRAMPAFPAGLMEDILERADGVPLFLEELSKAVAQAGDIGQAMPATVNIPATLHGSLLARLDRLGPKAKLIAQVGAALGREFSYEMLTAVGRRPPVEVSAQLVRLTEAGLIFQRGTPPDATCVFKHALVQDAIYSTLLRSQRRDLHLRIAKIIEERYPERVVREPEILAFHYAEAGEIRKAIAFWNKAGERAIRRSALAEATQNFRSALKLSRSLPVEAERDRMELLLQIALGRAMRVSKGIAAQETLDAFSKARALLDRGACTPSERGEALYGLWGVHWVRSDYALAHDAASECLAIDQAPDHDPALKVLGHYLAGASLWATGDLVEARTHLEQAIDLSAAPPGGAVSRALQTHEITALGYLSWTLWPLGYPDRALAIARRAEDRATRSGHVMLLALIRVIRSHLSVCFMREPDPSAMSAEDVVAFCAERGVKSYELWARFACGVTLSRRDGPARGIEVMRRAMDELANVNSRVLHTPHLWHFAAAHAELGQPEAGLEILREALDFVEATGDRIFEPELHRLKGELLLVTGKEAEAEAALFAALDVARAQQTRMWELRAATSLARLRSHQTRFSEARKLLAGSYAWFTDGLDTPDLIDARRLLDELDRMGEAER